MVRLEVEVLRSRKGRTEIRLPEGRTQWIGDAALQAAIVEDDVVTDEDVQAVWDSLPESQRTLIASPTVSASPAILVRLLAPLLVRVIAPLVLAQIERLVERLLTRKGT